MADYEPSPAFRDAADFLSHSSTLGGLSNNIKLELYGLFKTVTVSAVPTSSRPSIFDFSGRAKWDAWQTNGEKYGDRTQAEARYLALATELGWELRAAAPSQEAEGTAAPKDSEGIWDDEDAPRKGGGGGMGVRVSVMSPEDAAHDEGREEHAVHGFAVSGNEEGLRAFLDAHPNTDVDERDENGYTPLHLACDRGHAAVAKLLLSRGADPSIEDSDEYTAVELAQIAEHEDVVALFKA